MNKLQRMLYDETTPQTLGRQACNVEFRRKSLTLPEHLRNRDARFQAEQSITHRCMSRSARALISTTPVKSPTAGLSKASSILEQPPGLCTSQPAAKTSPRRPATEWDSVECSGLAPKANPGLPVLLVLGQEVDLRLSVVTAVKSQRERMSSARIRVRTRPGSSQLIRTQRGGGLLGGRPRTSQARRSRRGHDGSGVVGSSLGGL
eukprot:TRINITY_DN13943_c0_g1_i2.p1 TRINITY_DN13943_c0_g1~~TRINITY_DN13943_c0_g1_i2.p1  ORF type:complete len:205 (-),score=7.46 TRINITY_DN13943_c0_g1_i2:158-772(-)